VVLRVPETDSTRAETQRAVSGMSHDRRNLDNFIDETRASQRNIVFPDTVRNARSVDLFLWRGSPNPTLVQKIGAWMIGVVFIGCGIEMFSLAVGYHSSFADVLVAVSMSVLSLFIEIRTFRNGFPRPASRHDNRTVKR
jgi:hypothetical protein